MEIWKEFRFEAAHRLPGVAPDHKCARLHGHSFRVEVRIEGPVDPVTGMVRDFAEITHAFARLHDALDHRYLNDVPGLENPTSENLTSWIWRQLDVTLPGLCEVTVRETCTSGCVMRRQDLPQ